LETRVQLHLKILQVIEARKKGLGATCDVKVMMVPNKLGSGLAR
jgi:hypothetical protein